MRLHRHSSTFGATIVLALAGVFAGCATEAASPAEAQMETNGVTEQAASASTEDALAQAFGIFKQVFVNDGEDRTYHIGFGYHPGLSTSKVLVGGTTVSGQATLDFAAGTVTATLQAPTAGVKGFDLYFVK